MALTIDNERVVTIPPETPERDDSSDNPDGYSHYTTEPLVAGTAEEEEQPTKTPKRRFEWDEEAKDYVKREGDRKLLYTLVQKPDRQPPAALQRSASPNATGPQLSCSRVDDSGGESGSPGKGHLSPGPPSAPPPGSYGGQLDKRFEVVRDPRRFFSVGRIFKTVWFEPSGADVPGRRSDPAWTDNCQDFHESKPLAKFRWFVVVRKRRNHSLCFSITTFGGEGASKTRRGRAQDFVVLHKAGIPAEEPYEEEEIVRKPIAIVIEDIDQYISPLARLDCSRIYTVEDDVKVMKIGRVSPDCLERLDDYFKICVE